MKIRRTVLSLIFTSIALSMTTQLVADEAKPKSLDFVTHLNKSQNAFVTANRENKYLLLLFFNSDDLRSCCRMRDSMRDERLAHFSDTWIATFSNPVEDVQGKKFAEEFKVRTYPTAVLIKTTVDPKTRRVTRTDFVGRVEGEQSAFETEMFFRRAIHVYENRGRVLDVTTHHDRVYDTWEEVKRDDKFLVVVFNSNYCGFCNRTLDNMTDPRMAKYSGKFIVLDADPDFDTDAQYFADRFQVKKYPTILLLRPVMEPYSNKVKQVDLIGRMTGEQTAEEMDNYFQKCIEAYDRQRQAASD